MTRLPQGLVASASVALPTAAVGVSFGLLAAPLLGVVPAIVMSALVWSGTAQFAAISILGGGGGALLAGSAGLLANTRFLPMGFAIAPSMTARPLRRFFTGALLADASFVIGHRPNGRFDIAAIAWAAPLQYVGWLAGTIAGALGATAIGDPRRLGLDVLFPVFYLSLLLPELRSKPASSEESGPDNHLPVIAAALAAVITIALTPFTPPGVPILAAAAVALIGLRRPRPRATAAGTDSAA
jgi:predicted branched-subunit amino acid permease